MQGSPKDCTNINRQETSLDGKFGLAWIASMVCLVTTQHVHVVPLQY